MLIVKANLPLPEQVKEILKSDKAWLAGGAVRKLFFGHYIGNSDYDLFFAEGPLGDKAKETARRILNDWKVERDTDWAETFFKDNVRIQLVKVTRELNPTSTIGSFDITVCQFAYYQGTIYAMDSAVADCVERRVRVLPSNMMSPTSTLQRLHKYAEQGFAIPPSEWAAVLSEVAENPDCFHNDKLLEIGGDSDVQNSDLHR